MNRRALLSCWQASHGALSEEMQTRFLARPQVAELLEMGDETVRMAVRAHHLLVAEVRHARWLSARRLGESGCGCAAEDVDDVVTDGHRPVLLPGPDTRSGGPGGPRTATLVVKCSCGWERRQADPGYLLALWKDHASGKEEEPAVDW